MNRISTLWAAGTVALWAMLASGAAFAAGPNQAQADQLSGRDSWATSQSQALALDTDVVSRAPAEDGRYHPVAVIPSDTSAAPSAAPTMIAIGGRGSVRVIN